MTKIPDKRVGIFPLVYNNPAVKPARQPAPTAAKVARKGLTPWVIRVTATAPPKGKEPSVVISGKFRIRKVIKIPKPRIAQTNPCEIIDISMFDSFPLF